MTIAVEARLSKRSQMVLAYCAFAGLAMAVNLGAQWAVLRLALFAPHIQGIAAQLQSFAIVTAATAVGTAAGLVLKYFLDKRFIFRDPASGARAHARRFSLYAAGGLVTTAIPYLMELVTRGYYPRGPAVLVAGAIGLMIGYAVKFRLDRRFVFNRP